MNFLEWHFIFFRKIQQQEILEIQKQQEHKKFVENPCNLKKLSLHCDKT